MATLFLVVILLKPGGYFFKIFTHLGSDFELYSMKTIFASLRARAARGLHFASLSLTPSS